MHFRLIALVIMALAVGLVALPFVPPLQDFGDWIYQGFIFKSILAGHNPPFVIKPWPVPNSISQVLLASLMAFLPPATAARTFLLLYLCTFLSVCYKFMRPTVFIIVISMTALGSSFWNGYLNFQIGLLGLLCYIRLRGCLETPSGRQSMRVGSRPQGVSRQPLTKHFSSIELVYAVPFSVLLFFSHAVCFAAFVTLIGWQSLLNGKWCRGFAITAPACLLMLWYIVANNTQAPIIPQEAGHGIVHFLTYKVYTMAKLGPYQNFIIGDIGDYNRYPWLYYAGVSVNALYAVMMVIPLGVYALISACKRHVTPERLTALCCFGAFLVAPGTLFGVVNIGERFLVIGATLAIIECEIPPIYLNAGASLACGLIFCEAAALIAMDRLPIAANVSAEAINDPHQRLKLLFWHRSFQFAASITRAEKEDSTGVSPNGHIGFTTGFILPRSP